MGLIEWYERASARIYPEHARRTVNTWAAAVFGTAILGYGTHHITAHVFFDFSSHRGKALIVGSAAWVFYFGLACFSFALFGAGLGLQAKGENRLTYRQMQRWCLRIGLVVTVAALFMNELQSW